MTTTSIFPQSLYGNPRRPYQLASVDRFLPASPRANLEQLTKRATLKGMLELLQTRMGVLLRQGQPMVIGGGFVRDAIMGGKPNDIDIWLPSNINIRNVQDIREWVEGVFGVACTIVFSGPENVDQDGEGYRDMSNHWVVEFVTRSGFRVNLMRTMTEWTEAGPEAFFQGVMRNFDVDLCMFFLVLEGGVHTPYVVMPRHLVAQLNNPVEDHRFVQQFCWNSHRLDTMSEARQVLRRDKMLDRFIGLGPEGVVQVGNIIPQVVSISWLMSKVQYLPYPRLPVLNAPRVHDTMTLYGGTSLNFAIIDEIASVLNTEPEEDLNAEPLPAPPQLSVAFAAADALIRRTPEGHIDWS